jgi:hypothetical protein
MGFIAFLAALPAAPDTRESGSPAWQRASPRCLHPSKNSPPTAPAVFTALLRSASRHTLPLPPRRCSMRSRCCPRPRLLATGLHTNLLPAPHSTSRASSVDRSFADRPPLPATNPLCPPMGFCSPSGLRKPSLCGLHMLDQIAAVSSLDSGQARSPRPSARGRPSKE